jgi:hypothetical protein
MSQLQALSEYLILPQAALSTLLRHSVLNIFKPTKKTNEKRCSSAANRNRQGDLDTSHVRHHDGGMLIYGEHTANLSSTCRHHSI